MHEGLKAMFRLGNGEVVSLDPVHKLAMVISAGVGLVLTAVTLTTLKQTLSLSPGQFQLCGELSANKSADPRRIQAAFLLQAWWRLILMRHRGFIDIHTVFSMHRARLNFASCKAGAQLNHTYTLEAHLAAVEAGLRMKMRKIKAWMRLSRRLDNVIIREAQILGKTNILAGLRPPIRLGMRLPTIKEVMSDLSSGVKSPKK
jgi:hypothetical protein